MEEREGLVSVDPESEVLRSLREAVQNGQDWFLAVLDAMGRWTTHCEVREGRTYRYLIDGEAFDWLLLAERLVEAIDDLVPPDEKEALLFRGTAPLELSTREVKELIGERKFACYLNYFYGVTVEEGLLLAVQDEIEKEKRARCLRKTDAADEAYLRIYDETHDELLRKFRKEKRYPHGKSISLAELKEFTYWLFKYRFRCCERARIASDTRKALMYLRSQWHSHGRTGLLALDLAKDDSE